MIDDKDEDEVYPCDECIASGTCSEFEMKYCCTLCLWKGLDDCDNCNPMDS